MERTLRIKRLYRLGDYENIEIEDVFDNIPESLLLNKEFVDKVSELMLLRVESSFFKYVAMRSNVRGKSLEETSVLLEEEYNKTFEDVTKTL